MDGTMQKGSKMVGQLDVLEYFDGVVDDERVHYKWFRFTMRGDKPCVIVKGREYRNLSVGKINRLITWCEGNSKRTLLFYADNPAIEFLMKKTIPAERGE